jgi:RecQ family ATP-dependent DNA helicase
MENKSGQYSIKELVELKGCSIDEFITLADQKGIKLSEADDKMLSLTEIKIIDPSLAFKLRFNNARRKTSPKQSKETKEENKDSAKEHLSVTLNSIDNLNQKVQQKFSDSGKKSKPKAPNYLVLGIIKWFDGTKGFGFIVTNNCIISPNDSYHLIDAYYNTDSLIQSFRPFDGNLVVFNLDQSSKRIRAINVRRYDTTKEDLFLALNYIGLYSKIQGKDSKSIKVYNYDIIPSIYKNFWDKAEKRQEFLNIVVEYIESIDKDSQLSLIDNILNDPETCAIIESLLSNQEITPPNSTTIDVIRERIIAAVFQQEKLNWNKISAMINGGIDLSGFYPIIMEKLSDKEAFSTQERNFLTKIGQETVKNLIRTGNISDLPDHLVSFLFTAYKNTFASLFEKDDVFSDKELVLLYLSDNDFNHIRCIQNWEQLIPWINSLPLNLLKPFITGFVENVDVETDEVFAQFDDKILIDVMSDMDKDSLIQFLQQLPKQTAINYVVEHYAGTEIFDAIVGDYWKEVRASIPYVVFDLETDGDTIKEFAFKQEENTRLYQGEDQLNSLFRALKRQDVIVGHKIKDWDLEILKKKGLKTNSFIWDTLEIEMLLNPCRYAYSLHTQHDAKSDTELADKLFWNQLYRLSRQRDLCETLSALLPDSINDILDKLLEPYFDEIFKNSVNDSGQLFQELSDVSDDVRSQLEEIAEVANEEYALVVAPKTLWGKIAQYVPLSFVDQSDSLDYKILSKDKLAHEPLDNIFLHSILSRFLELSKTPVISNLAQYLRYNYFSDDILIKYLNEDNSSNIICCDIDGLQELKPNNRFSHIFFVGCEMDGRLCQYSLPDQLNTSDFLSRNCWIPMRMAGANYMIVTKEEQKLLGIKGLPDDVANVWVERQPNDKYQVFYNFNYECRIEKLKKDNKEAEIHYIHWNLARKKEQQNSIVLVNSTSRGHFVASQNRVGPVSRYRSLYWTIQLKIVLAIHEHETGTPIVYVLDTSQEISAVEAHARKIGFFIPETGSLARKMELICKFSNGLLVISKDQFGAVAGLKEFAKYIYIWDNLSVDKCRMMWTGKMPFGDEANTESEGIQQLLAITDATPKTCILATWPTIEFQNKYIEANNPESRLYVIDPYLDDFGDLAESWNTGVFSPQLWNNENLYNKDLKVAAPFYKDYNYTDYYGSESAENRISEAMEAIRRIFLPAYEWRESQMDALPAVLSKKTDCLISIPTGGGKSILFQGPALYYSAFTNRLSIVVTPLKALMEDQVNELHNPRLGFYTNVDYLNSDRSQGEVQQIYRKIKGGELALLYVTPERFRSRSFLNALQTRISNDQGLEYFIFDEAHCISQWGQEFRPDYLKVMEWCQELKKNYPQSCITLYSATVTKQIQDTIKKYLPTVERYGQREEDYNPIRSHIGMSFVNVANDENSRIKAIIEFIGQHKIDPSKSRMLVFCRTRLQCELCCLSLEEHMAEFGFSYDEDGHSPIGYFHAGMDADDREDIYQQFKTGKISILCATKAFGMGMDIPNVHYIVHYSPPSVLEDYLQEVGRAGRKKEDYEAAGFVGDKLLPTICLVSKDDFKKAKELLIKSMLSWSNLNEIRKTILNYIKPIQSIEKTQENPIVVPQNLWKKDQLDSSFTDFKLGLYWLQSMERIKMGFLCPSHINISIIDNSNKAHSLSNDVFKVFDYLKTHYKQFDQGVIQVSVNDLRCDMNMGYQAVLNALIVCAKNRWIRIEQDVRCEITTTRSSETNYRLNHDINVTLDIIFAAVMRLLSDQKPHKEFVLDSAIRTKLLNETLDDNKIETKPFSRKTKTGKTITEQYMLWYDGKETKLKNIGLAIAKNYESDLRKKRAKHIFTLLELIPGVKVKSYLDTESKEVKQIVSYESAKCVSYAQDLKEDCLQFLRYLERKNNKLGSKSGRLNWADCIIDLRLDNKGYNYLDTILHILKALGYVNSDGLLPIGIEIYTTTESEKAITDNVKPDSVDERTKRDFDLMNKMRKIRLASMNAFAGKGRDNLNSFISEYFKCVTFEDFFTLVSTYYDENNPEDRKFISSIQEEALIEQENKLGDEQKEIYNAPIDEDINVLAGPGSGKTHILTLRCARLIYKENVAPNEILVLAYNRAVVVELRNRLDRLFGNLGLSRSASQIHVHTFSALAKVICGKALDDVKLEEWEEELLNRLVNYPAYIKKVLPGIKYVMIDEFQDITQTRLDAIHAISQIYPGVKFFTIGDKNQSIYGFDKKIEGIPESTSPDYYYKQLTEKLAPHEYTMRTNYRSYPKILEAATAYLKDPSEAPEPSQYLKDTEPATEYVKVVNWSKGVRYWTEELPSLVEAAKASIETESKEKRIETIAIFFRSNDEVYRGYDKVSRMNFSNVRIRIQGASACELFRVREIYEVLSYLTKNSEREIVISGSQTQKELKEYIETLMTVHPKWDRFYLDFTYTLILDFLDFVASEEETYTYGQMAESIKDATMTDDGQIYKIYDRYESERIDRKKQLNIILTTMHKVKGLEFDAVVITPSFSSLPFDGRSDKDIDLNVPLTAEENEELEEERRLQYVAYTRARKILWVYRYNRELALDKNIKCKRQDASLGWSDISEIRKLFLSYMATKKLFLTNDYIMNNVVKNDKIQLSPYRNNKGKIGILVMHNGRTVGMLSEQSRILDKIRTEYESTGNLRGTMEGLFVNEVFVWTYEDSINNDQNNGTNFTEEIWSPEAIEKGFVYIVDFAGYAQINN